MSVLEKCNFCENEKRYHCIFSEVAYTDNIKHKTTSLSSKIQMKIDLKNGLKYLEKLLKSANFEEKSIFPRRFFGNGNWYTYDGVSF